MFKPNVFSGTVASGNLAEKMLFITICPDFKVYECIQFHCDSNQIVTDASEKSKQENHHYEK